MIRVVCGQGWGPHFLRGFTSSSCPISSALSCWYCHTEVRRVLGATAGGAVQAGGHGKGTSGTRKARAAR